MSVAVKYRAECPYCGKEVTVRENGRFWQHNNGKPQYPGSIWKQMCEMSGRVDTDTNADDSGHRFP